MLSIQIRINNVTRSTLWHYTKIPNWNQNRNQFLVWFFRCFSFVVFIYTNCDNLILNCILNFLVIRLTPFDFRCAYQKPKMAHSCHQFYRQEFPSDLRVSEWPSAQVPECQSALSVWEPKCPWNARVLLECPLSAKFSFECSSSEKSLDHYKKWTRW